MEFINKNIIASKVLWVKVVLSCETIAKAIGCLCEGSTYQESWEKNYDSHVTRALCRDNANKASDQKTIIYNLMCEKVKIWANILNKSVLFKEGSKTTLSDLDKFVLFHLMKNLSLDLPHTLYINMLRNLKGLRGLDDIYYAALINKFLWDQGVYHVFNKLYEDSKHILIVKGLIVAKQQKLSKTNLKVMKVALEQSLKEAPEVDMDAINKRKQKRQAKAIDDDDLGLNNFGISRKIHKIMVE